MNFKLNEFHYLLGRGFLPFALLIRHTQISGVKYPVVIIVYICDKNYLVQRRRGFVPIQRTNNPKIKNVDSEPYLAISLFLETIAYLFILTETYVDIYRHVAQEISN